jgi:hypothetical protein
LEGSHAEDQNESGRGEALQIHRDRQGLKEKGLRQSHSHEKNQEEKKVASKSGAVGSRECAAGRKAVALRQVTRRGMRAEFEDNRNDAFCGPIFMHDKEDLKCPG